MWRALDARSFKLSTLSDASLQVQDSLALLAQDNRRTLSSYSTGACVNQRCCTCGMPVASCVETKETPDEQPTTCLRRACQLTCLTTARAGWYSAFSQRFQRSPLGPSPPPSCAFWHPARAAGKEQAASSATLASQNCCQPCHSGESRWTRDHTRQRSLTC